MPTSLRDAGGVELGSSETIGEHMHVWVDPDRCRGHALCITRAPEAFEFIDLEDRAVVIDGTVTSIPLSVFQAAARECPERAIIISETAAAS